MRTLCGHWPTSVGCATSLETGSPGTRGCRPRSLFRCTSTREERPLHGVHAAWPFYRGAPRRLRETSCRARTTPGRRSYDRLLSGRTVTRRMASSSRGPWIKDERWSWPALPCLKRWARTSFIRSGPTPRCPFGRARRSRSCALTSSEAVPSRRFAVRARLLETLRRLEPSKRFAPPGWEHRRHPRRRARPTNGLYLV